VLIVIRNVDMLGLIKLNIRWRIISVNDYFKRKLDSIESNEKMSKNS